MDNRANVDATVPTEDERILARQLATDLQDEAREAWDHPSTTSTLLSTNPGECEDA